MKKLYSILTMSLILFAGIIFSACADKTYTANFVEDEYVLSINEKKDITSGVELENLTLQDLTFHSSDERIFTVTINSPLDLNPKIEIRGKSSGKAILYIYLRGEALDTVDVLVKNKFAVPTNIQCSDTGLITWDKVSATLLDGTISEPTYVLWIKPMDDEDSEAYVAYANGTSYQLPKQGRYKFCIIAGATKYVDESDESSTFDIYYQTVHVVENFKFENVVDGVSEKAILSWNAVSDADYYTLNIDGMKVQTTVNRYELDLSAYGRGESAVVSISACSYNDSLMDSPVSKIQVAKLGIESASTQNGVLTWTKVANASKYIIHYKSLLDPAISGTIETTELSSTLDTLDSGAYEITVQAIGKYDFMDEVYYANSKPVTIAGNVAKLGQADFRYTLVDGKISYSISTTDASLKDFEVKFTEVGTRKEIIRNPRITNPAGGDGVFSVSEMNIELAEVGRYLVSLKSMPTLGASVTVDGVNCKSVVSSKSAQVIDVYKLPTVGTLSHSYDENQGSVISFARPSYETNYSKTLNYIVKVNGIEATINKKVSQSGNYYLYIGDISTGYENPETPNSYIITVETFLTGLGEKTEYIGAVSSKTMSQLVVNTSNKQGDTITTNYNYSANGANGFFYKLYKTNDEYNDRLSLVASGRDEYGRLIKPSAGYYIIDITAYSSNPNQFLNGYATDFFNVTNVLEIPKLNFDKTTTKIENPDSTLSPETFSGYYLEITAVKDAVNYEIYINDTLLQEVADADEDGKIYYYFLNTTDLSNEQKTIKVVAKGNDDFLYKRSDNSIIINKLASIELPSQENQSLIFKRSEGDLVFYKNSIFKGNEITAQKVENAEKKGEYIYTIDLSNEKSDISILVYAKKDRELNNFYLDSDVATYKVHKIATMTNLYFSIDKVYFEYNDENEDVKIQAGSQNQNVKLNALIEIGGGSSVTSNFEIEIQSLLASEGGNKFSFDLNALVEKLIVENPEFASLYLQRDKIKLQLVANASFYDEATTTFNFSSQKAISKDSVEKDYITIEKIAKPMIYFSESTKQIFWADEKDKFDYVIRVNGIVTEQQAVYSTINERYEFSLASYYALGEPVVVDIKKSADNFLDSDFSNSISLYFTKPVTALNILTNEDGTSYARFNYTDSNVDLSRIKLNVNATNDIEVRTDATYSSYEFTLDAGVTNYTIYVVGYKDVDDDGNASYFVGSVSDKFILERLPEVVATTEFVTENGEITWTAYSKVDSPRYQVIFIKDLTVMATVSVEETKLSLSNSTLLTLPSGTYQVGVYAVNKNFSINGGEKNYYGGTIISSGTIIRLSEVENLNVAFDTSPTTIDEENAKEITLGWSFDGIIKDGANVRFDVYMADTKIKDVAFVDGQTNYSITLDRNTISEFANEIVVKVVSDKDIISQDKTMTLYRYSEPTVSISDEKLLSISLNSANLSSGILPSNGYIVKVTVNGSVIGEQVVLGDIDLTSIIGDHSGNYTIEVITKGVSNKAVASVRNATLTGKILAKPTVTQVSSGVSLTATDENVEYYISILQGGQVVLPETRLYDNKYDFADNLSGEYQIIAKVRRQGDLTSIESSLNVNISRIESVQNISLSRSRTFSSQKHSTTYSFTWDAVSNATSYELNLYNGSGDLLFTIPTLTNSITLDDTTIFSTLDSGKEYMFGVRACGDITKGNSNAKETKFAVSIAKQVDKFEITNGILSWKGGGDYFLYATDGTNSLKLKTDVNTNNKILKDDGSEIANSKITRLSTSENLYSIVIGELSGNINLSLVKIGTSADTQTSLEKYMLDSQNLNDSYVKLQEIESIFPNSETGKIAFTTKETYQDPVKFNFEYENADGNLETYAVELENEIVGGAKINTYIVNFAVLFDALGVDKIGEVEIRCYISQANKLRSEICTFSFENTKAEAGDYSALRGENALKDYLMINLRDNLEIKNIYLKMRKEGDTASTYYIISATEKKGYWNVFESNSSFSQVADGAALSSKEVCAIFMNGFEGITDVCDYTFSIAYVYTSATAQFGVVGWSEEMTYTKLPTTNDPVMSNGKITWSINSALANNNVTGYYVLFVNQDGEENYIYVPSADKLEVETELIASSLDTYVVYVIAVNTTNTFMLASNKQELRSTTNTVLSVIKTDNLANAVTLSGGTLKMSLRRDGSDASYGTILKGTLLTSGTTIAVQDMPYGYGRYYACLNSDLQFNVGQGTFTAIKIDDTVRYVRTSFITKSGDTYTINADAVVYEMYNTALEDLLDDYASKFSKRSQVINVLSKTAFNYPFVYTLDSLKGQSNKINLLFKDKDTNEVDTLTVNALNLISLLQIYKHDASTGDLSTVSLLETLKEILADKITSYTGYDTVNGFYGLLADSSLFTGVACDKLLFDQIGADSVDGKTGEDVEGGVYQLSVMQVGLQVNAYNFGTSKTQMLYALNSTPAVICEDCEVIESPTTKTYKVLNDDQITSSYFIKLSPSVSNGTVMNEYVMSLSWPNTTGEGMLYRSYTIRKVGDDWRFYISGSNSFVLNTIVEDLKDYILIPLNGENGLNGLGLSDKNVYTVNIYAKGGTTKFSSKTEPITLTFLGFNDNISLDEKGFKIMGYKNDGMAEEYNGITVVYKRSGSEQAEKTFVAGTEEGRYFLPNYDGLYEYIMFMTTGEVNKYSVKVDSIVYRIENVYKLYKPTVVVGAEGVFEIQNNETNPADYLPVFKITNNKSIEQSLQNPESAELEFVTSATTYKPGANKNTTDKYKLTESQASSFRFVAKGSLYETFVKQNENGFKMLKHDDNEILYLTSNANVVNGILLETPQTLHINADGDVEWSKVAKAGFNGQNNSAVFTDGETVIVYKVVIEYYYETLGTDGTSLVWTKDNSKVDTYYTRNTVLPATYVRGADESEDYRYVITVLAFACKDSQSLSSIATSVSGLTLQNVRYVDTSTIVVTSADKTQTFTRLEDVTNINVTDGKLTWKYNNYDSSKHEFKVFYAGQTGQGLLKGEYVYNTSLARFEFALDESERVLSSLENYTVSVYAYPKDPSLNMMTSFTASRSNIKIVPMVADTEITNTNEYIDIVQDGVTKTVAVDTYDLYNYFQKYKSDSYAKTIEVSYKTFDKTGKQRAAGKLANNLYYNSESQYDTKFRIQDSSSELNKDDTTQFIYVQSGYSIEISFKVVTATENYFGSYTTTMNLTRKDWGGLDKIKYNSNTSRFEWSFGKETQYYIGKESKIYSRNTLQESDIVGVVEAGTIVSLGQKTSKAQQITFIANNGASVTVWVDLGVVLSREVEYTPTEKLYFSVMIEYKITEVSGEVQRDHYYTRTYKNVTDTFFIPEIMGSQVVSFKIQAREGEKNLATTWLVCDEFDESAGKVIDVNIFASGEGTSDSPYVVTNEEEFKNMALFGNKPAYLNAYTYDHKIIERNALTGQQIQTTYPETGVSATCKDTKYMFVLADNITLTSQGQILVDKFSSVLDGKGYTITFSMIGGEEIENNNEFRYANGATDVSNVKFNQFGAIVNEITEYGEIKNLNISVDYTYSPISGKDTKTLFAGLALFNRGKVEDIKVTGYGVNFLQEINSTLAVCGIVGVNYGEIADCSFSAGVVNISNTNSSQQILLVGGIAGFNVSNAALITRCEVAKDSKLVAQLSKSAAGIVQVGGVAISNYYGSITLCGNSGEVGGTCTNGTGYSAGVVVYTYYGKVIDCYNAGNVRGSKDYIAGIIYVSSETNIENLIGVGSLNGSISASSYLIVRVDSNGSARKNCYSRYSLSVVVPTTAITKSQTISAKSNTLYEINVTVSGSTYTIAIANKA